MTENNYFQFVELLINYSLLKSSHIIDYREVFKAREKRNSKKFVAMKKVLMDNEKEGVS